MQELLTNYKKLLEERLDRYRLLNIGEDTIRYDFFSAILQTYNFRPAQIQIEVPINAQCFIPLVDKNSKRKEKPLIDLVVAEPELNISVEFGLFRQNTNEDGSINKTARTVKMLNDMVRVALETNFTQAKGLFICVADHKILGHQMTSKIIGRFPSDYLISNKIITHQLQQKTNHFDRRFLSVFSPMNRNIKSTLIFNERLEAQQIKNETRLLIWEVSLA
jgi:hypothetical protein